MTDNGRVTIGADAAIAALPEGRTIHTFMDAGVALIGADWPREKLIDALRSATRIDVTGDQAQSMRHGLAIEHPSADGSHLFIETARRTDNASAPTAHAERAE